MSTLLFFESQHHNSRSRCELLTVALGDGKIWLWDLSSRARCCLPRSAVSGSLPDNELPRVVCLLSFSCFLSQWNCFFKHFVCGSVATNFSNPSQIPTCRCGRFILY